LRTQSSQGHKGEPSACFALRSLQVTAPHFFSNSLIIIRVHARVP